MVERLEKQLALFPEMQVEIDAKEGGGLKVRHIVYANLIGYSIGFFGSLGVATAAYHFCKAIS
jgi:hypothetical protein